jgi:MarR family transcriptional regulator, organic hydroperoxide resistance regulator
MARLADEIRMTKPFTVAEEEASLSILRTCEVIQQSTLAVIKGFDLTGPQYNVLRILRGSSPEGLPCGQISERMITRDPDITRLLDRLETRGLISRMRGDQDRRVVIATITPEGLRLLQEIDPVVVAHHRRQFSTLNKTELRELIRLLQLVREGSGNDQGEHYETDLHNRPESLEHSLQHSPHDGEQCSRSLQRSKRNHHP